MKITKISVSRAVKLPQPDIRYSMIELFASAEAKVGEKEDLTQSYIELTDIVRVELKRQYKQWQEREPIGEASI